MLEQPRAQNEMPSFNIIHLYKIKLVSLMYIKKWLPPFKHLIA